MSRSAELQAWIRAAVTPTASDDSEANRCAAAATVAGELRAQIDEQIRAARDLDTRAVAVLSVLGLFLGIVAPRLAIHPSETSHAVGILFLGLGGIACATEAVFAVTSRRRSFSFGADPSSLVASVEDYRHSEVVRGMIKGLEGAIARNEEAMRWKHDRFIGELVGFLMAVFAVAVLLDAGALLSGSTK